MKTHIKIIGLLILGVIAISSQASAQITFGDFGSTYYDDAVLNDGFGASLTQNSDSFTITNSSNTDNGLLGAFLFADNSATDFSAFDTVTMTINIGATNTMNVLTLALEDSAFEVVGNVTFDLSSTPTGSVQLVSAAFVPTGLGDLTNVDFFTFRTDTNPTILTSFSGEIYEFQASVGVIPEPSTYALLALGGTILLVARRRLKKQ